MKVLVCGGRDFIDQKLLVETLDSLHKENTISLIINGGAAGADNLSSLWAKSNKVSLCVEYADWYTYGLRAGPIRNRLMLDKHRPDLVVAFPGGKGTTDCIKAAEERNIQIRYIGVSSNG